MQVEHLIISFLPDMWVFFCTLVPRFSLGIANGNSSPILRTIAKNGCILLKQFWLILTSTLCRIVHQAMLGRRNYQFTHAYACRLQCVHGTVSHCIVFFFLLLLFISVSIFHLIYPLFSIVCIIILSCTRQPQVSILVCTL